MKMRFKDFIFPSNPSVFEISSSTNIAVRSVYHGNSDVQSVSLNPIKVNGNGEFFGDEAEESCQYLMHMLRTKESGALLLPSGSGFNAYLNKFTFFKNAQKNSISYTFEFTENCSSKKELRELCFTVCKNGENAFDIAGRCNVSVDDIMKYNDLKTPFDIKEGEKVVIR